MSQALATVFAQVKSLSMDDQRALNKLLVANIRLAMRQKAVMTAITFKAGDVVKFDGKTRGPIFIKIHSFSRDLTKVKGVQLNRGWKTQPGVQWTVGATVCRASTVAEAEANKF
jgi:hypothetical protein